MVDIAYEHHHELGNAAMPHTPVMLKKILEYLSPPEGGCVVDCTVGLGGHSKALAERLGPRGRLIAIDRDKQSLQVAEENLKGVPVRKDFIHEDFRRIERILNDLGVEGVDIILLDLGISSYQLDDPQRGFSINAEGPLDMRMDQDGAFSAYDLINSLSEKEIDSILKLYGEERLHKRIAHFLVEERRRHPIESTKDLKDLVLRALPRSYQRQKIHPATRTFQAFRIAVNRELESLEVALSRCADFLKPGGRIGVIAFHSLEDRIVKQKFRSLAKAGAVQLLTKKPLRPTEEETQVNPRSRSARFRVAERTATDHFDLTS